MGLGQYQGRLNIIELQPYELGLLVERVIRNLVLLRVLGLSIVLNFGYLMELLPNYNILRSRTVTNTGKV